MATEKTDTLTNLVDDAIRALSAEAGAHGDLAQVAICDRALAGDLDAWRECRRVMMANAERAAAAEAREPEVVVAAEPEKTKKPARRDWKCQECGARMTAKAAERAMYGESSGCPKCGGVDIDLEPASSL